MKNLLSGKSIFIISIVLLVILIIINSNRPTETDWRFDFTSQSQLPYGCKIIQENLHYVFPNVKITTTDHSVYETLQDTSLTSKVYLIINDSFEPDEFDMNRLLNFMRNGGIVLASAFKFSEQFQDSTGIRFVNRFYDYQWDSLSFVDTNSVNTAWYQVSKHNHPIVILSEDTDTSMHTVYARNDLNEPVYFSKEFGAGRLYLHLFPIGFSNYFLTEPDAYDFAYNSLAFIPEKDVIWDEYYKTGKIMIKSPLRYILSEPHLSWAYYILLIAAVLFIFLHGKREQRIIPVIKSFTNTSLEYYKKAALLRKFRSKSAKEVQILKETFTSRVALHFRLSGNIFSEENSALVASFSTKAEQVFKHIEKEFERIARLEKPGDEIRLLILSIDNFYKHTGIYAKRRYRF